MVKDDAQLYTIEGISAAILMVVTTYLVISTSSVFTPQETHITDMQLEQLGHDSLMILNTPRQTGDSSILYQSIRNNPPLIPPDDFNTQFSQLLNSLVSGANDSLHYNVTLYYRNGDQIVSKPFADDGTGYFRENAVKVTQWVKMGNDASDPVLRDKIILVEALIWRS